MLDIGWAELFVMAVIALLVVGPKELPAMLRTIGKFVSMIKRQAQDFRSQFDEAIKDTEFEQVKNDLQDLKSEATSTISDVRDGFKDEMRELDDVRRELDEEHAKLDAEMKREYGETGTADEAGDDWLEQHNRAVLEAEKAGSSSNNGSEPTATDLGDPQDAPTAEPATEPETEVVSPPAEAAASADPEPTDSRQPEKAGAAS
ncbi:MAG: Sec-independent protein translocase protein TatB [Pseudomonadota bacterium]